MHQLQRAHFLPTKHSHPRACNPTTPPPAQVASRPTCSSHATRPHPPCSPHPTRAHRRGWSLRSRQDDAKNGLEGWTGVGQGCTGHYNTPGCSENRVNICGDSQRTCRTWCALYTSYMCMPTGMRIHMCMLCMLHVGPCVWDVC